MLRKIFPALVMVFGVGGLSAQARVKRPLDHSAYDIWKTLGSESDWGYPV